MIKKIENIISIVLYFLSGIVGIFGAVYFVMDMGFKNINWLVLAFMSAIGIGGISAGVEAIGKIKRGEELI